MTRRSEPHRLILYGIVMTLVALAAVVILFQIRGVLLLLYVSTLLAIGLSPAVHWLEGKRFTAGKRSLPRWAAILVLYLGFLSAVAILLALVTPPLGRQLAEFWKALPGYADQLQGVFVKAGLLERQLTWGEVFKNVETPGIARGILGALQSVIGVFATLVTVLILPYYLLVEAAWLQRVLLHLFPEERRPRVARITRDVTLKVGAWLSGQILLAAVIGVTASIGLWILGVPYFYVLGLIAGLGEFVPIVGPISASIPAILMGMTVSLRTGIFVAIYFIVQQLIENNVLVPRIMERQVGVSAVTIIVALLIGGELLGVVGAILAVPTAAIIQVVLQEYFQRERN